MTPSRRSSRDQPPTISTASSNASGVAQRGDLAERAQAQLRVAVALQAGDEEAARRSSPVESKWSIAFARRQLFDATRAPASTAQACCSPQLQVLDGDPPQLALEDLRAPLGSRGHRHDAPLDAQPAAAAAAHRPDDDRAAAVDVAVEQRVQRHDRVVVRRRRVDEVDDDARLLARVSAA